MGVGSEKEIMRLAAVVVLSACAALLINQPHAIAAPPSQELSAKLDALTDALCAHVVLESGSVQAKTFPPFSPKVCRDAPHLVFVTSQTYNGDVLGGTVEPFRGDDFKCNELASAAGLPGIYKAWVVDNSATGKQIVALRFFRSSGPYVLVDGTIVAVDWDDLTDGSLLAPINVNEKGEIVSVEVWSNVATDGTVLGNASADGCSSWLSNLPTDTGRTGLSTETGPSWTNHSSDTCEQPKALYCFGQ